ncbi:hypothetical protein BDR07DRAFT_403867 [Suillus spraguei]|nr:hypothetical protein BDR07DRAFT_403867 [Suillus spraguei]
MLCSYATAWNLQFTTYIYVSMATFWCHDYICSLHEEWTYLLRSDWSMLKGLYIVTRYLPFSLLAIVLWLGFDPNETLGGCSVLAIVKLVLSIALVFFSEFFFMLRTYVLWNKNKILLAAMLTTFFVFLLSANASYQDPYSNNWAFWWTFILLTVFELGLMVLTFIRAIQSWRINSSRLYVVLVKHNILYYACALLLSVANVITSRILISYEYDMFYAFEVMILRSSLRACTVIFGRRTDVHTALVMSDMSSVNVTVSFVERGLDCTRRLVGVVWERQFIYLHAGINN